MISPRAEKLRLLLANPPKSGPPVIAVVCGSGQIARCAVEGGADFLVALSAGYFRNLGTGSLASLMPYANANDVTERLLREQILPCRGRVPVIAGVVHTDPTHDIAEILQHFRRLGVDGITNWPAAGFYDGVLRQAMEQERLGVDAEVALLSQARALGMSAYGFALDPEAAGRFAEIGVEALILDMGLTRTHPDVAVHRDQLQQGILRLQEMLRAVRRTGRQPLLLGFGGAVNSVDDLNQVLRQSEIAGFAGGSVFERLPVQEIVTATVRRFKAARVYADNLESPIRLGEMIGCSAAMRQLFELIPRIAQYDVNVSIEGETGTGKELVAGLLHQHSSRRHGPFVTLNCGAIPETLVESELFGHEKGAFTGAHRRRLGKFELAHHGTLFLDEVGDLSPHAQVALLRAIQEREITRVGGESPIPVDARIVAASHKSLPQLIRDGKFRADLYYRLNHMMVSLPPLRERREDIPVLATAILARLSAQLNRGVKGLADHFSTKLNEHSWPGNVRELEHVLRQAAILEDAPFLTGRFFIPDQVIATKPETSAASAKSMAPAAKSRLQMAEEALAAANGNKSHAAAALGVTRKTLYAWLRL